MPRKAQIRAAVVQPAREEQTQVLPQEPMRVIVHGEDDWERAIRQERLSPFSTSCDRGDAHPKVEHLFRINPSQLSREVIDVSHTSATSCFILPL